MMIDLLGTQVAERITTLLAARESCTLDFIKRIGARRNAHNYPRSIDGH